MQFEIQIPHQHNPNEYQRVTVEGENWLMALRDGLRQQGEVIEMRNIICDITGDNDVQITESMSGRIFFVTEVREGVASGLPEQTHAEGSVIEAPQSNHGATEAFIPPVNYFEEYEKSASVPEPEPVFPEPEPVFPEPEPMIPVAVEPAPSTAPDNISVTPEQEQGQPVTVMPVGNEPSVNAKPLTDVPFALPQTEDILPEEDLAFSDPLSIEATSKPVLESARPVRVETPSPIKDIPPKPKVEQVAVLAEEPLPPLASPIIDNVKPEPPKKPIPPKPKPAPPTPPPAAPLTPPPAAPLTPDPASNMMPSLSISGSAGKYSPGMTTEILADAFMRAMEIYDYGEDRRAAMQFVIDLALNNMSAIGGAVLLTDINSPHQELWFEVASGPHADELLNFRIPIGQGIIGYCAHEGVSQAIADVSAEPRYQSDVMYEVGLPAGSILCVPIQNEKRILGVIMMYNAQGERPFSSGEQSILNYIAHTAGEYLINLI